MSKNIAIKEGGTAKQLTVDKLKTNVVGGGTCLWVPEDDVVLGTKDIDSNGTFKASDDGFYGYSQVMVNNAGVAVGKMPVNAPSANDGNEYMVTGSNGDGDLEFLKLPSTIRVTTLPTTSTYDDGDTIDYTGMVVTKYDANGSSMGTIPLSELVLSVTEADYGSAYHEEWTDGAGVNALMLTYTERWYLDWKGDDKAVYCSKPMGEHNGLPAMFGCSEGPTQFLITEYDGAIYTMGSTADRHLNGYTYDASAERSNYILFCSTSFTTGTGEVKKAGHLYDWPTGIPISTVEPTDAQELHPEQSSKQTIPVKWARTGDGKELQTSFEITVNNVVTVANAD